MRKVTIRQAKSELSELIKLAQAGEEIIIASRDLPLVKLTPVESRKRRLGTFAGQGWIAEDFDEGLECSKAMSSESN